MILVEWAGFSILTAIALWFAVQNNSTKIIEVNNGDWTLFLQKLKEKNDAQSKRNAGRIRKQRSRKTKTVKSKALLASDPQI